LGDGHDPAALEGADDEVVMEEGVVAHPPQSGRLSLVDQREPMVRRWTRLEPRPSEHGDLLDCEREEQFVVLLAARPTAPLAGAEAAVRVRGTCLLIACEHVHAAQDGTHAVMLVLCYVQTNSSRL
jgi:hypothetical protein